MKTYLIEDEFHGNSCGRYASFEEAVAALKNWATLPWDENGEHVAPCQSWRTCRADYFVHVEDDSGFQEGRPESIYVLSLSAEGAKWQPPYDSMMKESTGEVAAMPHINHP